MTYNMITHCFICGMPAENMGRMSFRCFRCGEYRLSEALSGPHYHMSRSENQVANASTWIRYNQGEMITNNLLKFLESLPSPPVSERAENLLLYFASQYPNPGQSIFYNIWKVNTLIEIARKDVHAYDTDAPYLAECERMFPLLSLSNSSGSRDLIYLIFDYLHKHKRLLGSGEQDGSFTISPQGWDYIGSRTYTAPQYDQAFVAMWFDDSMLPIYTSAICPGIESAGYKPFRIDRKEHNNRIDDEIIVEIRRSKFTLADFTAHRGGVYFEAGFTIGLGRHVIWLCREDELDRLHFDTRQYNFIKWTPDKIDDLSRAISRRILATIGQGNYKKP